MNRNESRPGGGGSRSSGDETASSTQMLLDGMPASTPDTVNVFFAADADRAIGELAATGAFFTADDLWARGVGRPAHPNMVGPVFAVAHKHRLIRRAGWCPSRRSGRNGSAIAVWVGVQK